jgi:hypothetical protein
MTKQHEPLLTKEYLDRAYDSAEFTFANGLSDYDVKANQSASFKNCPIYTTINVRSDKAVSIKLNATTNPAITIQANIPMELDNLMEITNIYLTNASGDTANIKIIGVRKGV